jgi:hypothetical protein
MSLFPVSAAWLRVPTVSAFGFIKLFAEGAYKDIDMAFRNEKVIGAFFSLKLSLCLLIVACAAVRRGWRSDVVVKGGD